VLSQLRNVDDDLAARVAAGLAMQLPAATKPAVEPIELDPSPALSILANARPMLKGRKVGILFAEGSEKAEIERVKAMIEAAGATAMLIAPKVGATKVKGGTLKADGQLAGTPSCTLDAIALVLSEEAAATLARDGAAVQFVMDAFGHLKAIGHSAGAAALLAKAGVERDDGVTGLDKAFASAAARRFHDREPKVRSLA
jgi:catalase